MIYQRVEIQNTLKINVSVIAEQNLLILSHSVGLACVFSDGSDGDIEYEIQDFEKSYSGGKPFLNGF